MSAPPIIRELVDRYRQDRERFRSDEHAWELVVRLRKSAWEAGLTLLVITNFEERC